MSQFPILEIPRSAGDQALLDYKLTPDESKLFREIGEATGKLPEDAPATAYDEVAIDIGKKYGLTPPQAVAFFIRSTFSIFEP
jgi:hypothetical protein